jgi:hypothetical protein
MDRSFNASEDEAEHAAPMPPSVFQAEDPQILDEDPEILACWVAAQQVNGVEARILELRLISQDMRTQDLRGAIDGAIEDCELHRGELVEFLAESGTA